MRQSLNAVVWVVCGTAVAVAQTPQPLPKSLTEPAVKEELVSFDVLNLSCIETAGRWQLRSGTVLLKDFGGDRASATETARILRELRPNQMGTVPGSQPLCEYWLSDGKPAKASNARLVIFPIAAKAIRAEQVAGAWVVSDGTKVLYDFGDHSEEAKKAAAIFRKHGFNQLGIVGSPKPTLFVPLFDPRQAAADARSPLPDPAPLNVLSDVGRTSLLLPGDVRAGGRAPFDTKTVAAVSEKGVWTLRHDGQVLATFNGGEGLAKGATKCLKDLQPTEICRVGKAAMPIFLRNGEALRGEPLGTMKVSWKPERLKVQKLRESHWLFEEHKPILDCGSKTDAESYLAVIRTYDLRTALQFGRPETGGIWILTAGR